MPAGRPIEITQNYKDTIIDMIAIGESVGKISKTIGKQPSTIYRWIDEDAELKEIYARAKESKAQVLAEEIIDIADDPDLKPDDKRIRVDARKWVAGKYYGKLFGDRVHTEHSGVVGLTNLTDDELDRKIAELEQAKRLINP